MFANLLENIEKRFVDYLLLLSESTFFKNNFLDIKQLGKRSMDSFCGIFLVFRVQYLYRLCAEHDYDVCW